MESNTQTGNKVVWLLAALVLVLCSLNVEWGSAKLTQEDVVKMSEHEMNMKGGFKPNAKLTQSFAGLAALVPLPINAASAFYIGPIRLPYWAGCVCCGFGLVVLILNLVRFSSVPKLVILLLMLFGLFTAVWALISTSAGGSVGPGPVLLLAAAVMGSRQTIQNHAIRLADTEKSTSSKNQQP